MGVGSLPFLLIQVIECINPGVFCSRITSRPGAENQRTNAWRAPNEDCVCGRENGSSHRWPEQLEFTLRGPGEVTCRKEDFQRSCVYGCLLVSPYRPSERLLWWISQGKLLWRGVRQFQRCETVTVFLVPISLHLFSRGEGACYRTVIPGSGSFHLVASGSPRTLESSMWLGDEGSQRAWRDIL